MKNVLILTEGMTPYRIPVWNEINKQNDINLEVWYLQEKENNRSWHINKNYIEYKYSILDGKHYFIQSMDLGFHFNPGLFAKLKSEAPDLIITTSYHVLGFWTALFYAKLFNKKLMVWWGSTLKSSRVKNLLMNLIRKVFFFNTDSFITYGTEATNALLHYNVDEKKIFTGYNTVDINYFYKNQKKQVLNLEKNRNVVNFLFVGQLITRKGLNETFKALCKLSMDDWKLSIIGDGEEKDSLVTLARTLGIEKNIEFLGYKQQHEVVYYLSIADCLIFPSLREVWGLVVNEALVTRTFVLSSEYAGVTRDLIHEKKNGIVIDPYKEDEFTNSINWVIQNIDYVRNEAKSPLSVWKKMHHRNYGKQAINAINSVFE
ncbi:glycosyltransferase family 4 protein [Halobacillus faecis]